MNAAHLRMLLEAHFANDTDGFKRAAMQAACTVRSELERLRLLRMVERPRASAIELFGKEAASLVVALPRRELASVALPEPVAADVALLLRERARFGELLAHGLSPRSRVLLHGPPGCGKTSLGAALATAMGLNGFVLQLAAARGSFLGETAKHITRAFDIAQNPSCLLLVDEIDALAEVRSSDGSGATREAMAVVASMLQLLDRPVSGMLVATTNRLDMVDPAIRRRFDAELELPAPSPTQIVEYAASLFEKHDHKYLDWGWSESASLTYAAVERAVTAAIRREVCR